MPEGSGDVELYMAVTGDRVPSVNQGCHMSVLCSLAHTHRGPGMFQAPF